MFCLQDYRLSTYRIPGAERGRQWWRKLGDEDTLPHHSDDCGWLWGMGGEEERRREGDGGEREEEGGGREEEGEVGEE